ncbi:hypothetical protein K443DRAFT_134917 [Laccaria amethystina LaAM-08-1]|uniref:Uncharacterized protein n=1 Tax=Laccaria amethystina LaAM-08-1 TaxID=1095629 RepID=A0A0C9X8M9_9AGAR|nr:hypothetical protein K443DRAFT_134917 [Laccaria amethystina LaAM-08-1]
MGLLNLLEIRGVVFPLIVGLTFFNVFLTTQAHVAAWHKGMYCLNGSQPGVNNQNTNDAVQPLFMLNKSDWWFHHLNNCDQFPPDEGDFLELPANGVFTVEHAVNRAFTTLSYNGSMTALFGDGENHPGLGVTSEGKNETDCIVSPNIHTQNQSMAAGTAFAISYTSDLKQVTEENLVVFTVLYNTPWFRIAEYQVPNLPACPEPGGCICATGSSAVAPAVPPVWCEDDKSKCIQGPKQMVYWNQLEGNNIVVSGSDLSGNPRSPTYNAKLGFSNGSQTDIFLSPGTASTTVIYPAATPSPILKSAAMAIFLNPYMVKSLAFVCITANVGLV